MFKKQYESHETVTIIFEGKSLDVEIGQTVAAALLGDGHLIFLAVIAAAIPAGPAPMMV